jgi:hypothetical protein
MQFYFAAFTSHDLNEWLSVLGNRRPDSSLSMEREHDMFSNLRYRPNSRLDDSDARSVYSVNTQGEDDETASVSGPSRPESRAETEDDFTINSRIETLVQGILSSLFVPSQY